MISVWDMVRLYIYIYDPNALQNWLYQYLSDGYKKHQFICLDIWNPFLLLLIALASFNANDCRMTSIMIDLTMMTFIHKKIMNKNGYCFVHIPQKMILLCC